MNSCFAPSSENLTRDKLLSEKIARLSTWVTPEHFDIKGDKINIPRLKPAIVGKSCSFFVPLTCKNFKKWIRTVHQKTK